MDIDPMVSRHEFGTPTKKSLRTRTGGYKTLC